MTTQTSIISNSWHLRLYIAGQTPRSLIAISNLYRIVDEHLKNKCLIEIIDLLENPDIGEYDRIMAIPTLVRIAPEPRCKIIGDLSNTEKTLLALELSFR